MISVIVTTYNQAATIARTLDSVLMQRLEGVTMEVVVGEDGSHDGTRRICEDYARCYPDVIRLMPAAANKGIIDNYFDCLLACRGDYIADCAGDDYWTDELKLQKEWELMEADRSLTVVHTHYRVVAPADPRGTTPRHDGEASTLCDDDPQRRPDGAGRRVDVVEGTSLLEAILTQTERPVIHLCTALYRRDVVMQAYNHDTYLFRNKAFECEDLQICFMLARAGRVAKLADSTVAYTVGGETISTSTDSRRQFAFVRGTTNLSHYMAGKYGVAGPAVSRFFARRLFTLLMHAWRARDSEFRREALACGRRWGVGVTWPVAAVCMATSNRVTWSLTLCLRQYVLKLKAHRAARGQSRHTS